jgi:uncharacterized membrane protein YdbT with pleckstrin-like domain
MSRITFDSPDEVEKFHAQESWVPVVLGGIPVLLVCVAVCALVVFAFHLEQYVPWMVVGTIVVVLASRIPHIIDNWQTDVVVTDRRLYYRHGIVNVRDHVCDLTTITDIAVDPNIIGRIFGYANVTIQTQAGEDDFELKEIKDAYEMRKVINQCRDELLRSDYY